MALTEKNRQHLSEIHKGDKNPSKRPEVREKIRKTIKKLYKEGKIKGFQKGHEVPKEWKEKFRERMKKKIGKDHWNWKGGITPELELLRHSLEYEIWKLEVYKRDKGKCRLCGIRCDDKTIVAHHLNNFNDFPELRFSVDNGIVLCRSCHIKLHNYAEKLHH